MRSSPEEVVKSGGQWRPGWPAVLKARERRELIGMIILMLAMPLFQIGLETIWRWLRPIFAH